MTTRPVSFSPGDASAPTGRAVPTPREVEAIGVIGLDIGKSGRATLMNQIGAALGIPPGGWHRQARLFDGDDVRLRWLLASLANQHQARLIANNLARAGRYVHVNLMLTMVSAAREFDRSLTAQGTELVETYHCGGLDFLWDNKQRLGLPLSVTNAWKPVPAFTNLETNHLVHPARIPAYDQLMAYGAQIASSFSYSLQRSLRRELGDQATPVLAAASRLAVVVWQAYAFLAPGGNPYDAKKPLRDQLGQHFGHGSALGYYVHKAKEKEEKRTPSLDDILTDHSLDHLEWLQSAKTRAAETFFLEQLLKRARELLPS
jgi:hypothetical protein